MITRNFKNIIASLLQSYGSAYGMLSVVNVGGTKYYFSPQFGKFPNTRAATFVNVAANAGISFGTGATPATEDDYQLQNTITGGVNVVLTGTKAGCNPPANPFIEYTFTITNTSSSTLTITEVGYKQVVNAATTPGRNASAEITVLLDRTVLDTALAIEAGDAGVLVYRLETIPEQPRQISGVDIVSFEWGSDAQLGAMIDAAQAGTINLQTDAGWKVGDMRKIAIAAFTGGGGTAHAAQYVDIVITSFDDYENCGCVLQFDFKEALATGQRMNSSNTTTGGYGGSEMYTTTLPALVAALPSWLASRLKTFDVQATIGGGSSTLETVGNNKLALRSAIEVFGSGHNGKAAEGSWIPYYANAGIRTKLRGYAGSADIWWERSPNNASYFCYVGNNGVASSNTASYAYGVAPFGCI